METERDESGRFTKGYKKPEEFDDLLDELDEEEGEG